MLRLPACIIRSQTEKDSNLIKRNGFLLVNRHFYLNVINYDYYSRKMILILIERVSKHLLYSNDKLWSECSFFFDAYELLGNHLQKTSK